MDYTTLGRTGLRVSVMGLGCGGHSRLGLSQDRGDDNAVRVVRRALDLGINFIDTAENYGTEPVVRRALDDVPRDRVIISTKVSPRGKDKTPRTGADITQAVHDSLGRLRTDYVDVLHLHGVSAGGYAHAVGEQYPALVKLRDAGKVRFIGVTEAFGSDTGHAMLGPAVAEGPWDVVMVGFNLLNPSARERVLAHTRRRGIGTLCMFAVRRALTQRDALAKEIEKIAARGALDAGAIDPGDPLGFLTQGHAAARDLPDAAYRFCRHEPGIDVVLVGTGSVEHLEENAQSLNRPPLRGSDLERLRELFGKVDFVSGN